MQAATPVKTVHPAEVLFKMSTVLVGNEAKMAKIEISATGSASGRRVPLVAGRH